MKNICSDNLTDKEYLEHMIPHHQVAVDISIMLQKKSKSVKMQDILRKLIWIQNYEITMMKDMLNTLPDNLSSGINNTSYIKTVSDFIEPNKLGLTNTYCDPLFFDPEKHMKHMHHMKLDDIVYIEHMIPHHQVAVDMSKILIKNTKNDMMLFLAYRIIKSQQDEIIMLDDYLESLKTNKDFVYQSELLLTYI
jgi:uncharacterized protein (DUF305 family)